MEGADVDRHEKTNRMKDPPYDTRRKPRKIYSDSLVYPELESSSATPAQVAKRKRASIPSEPTATLAKTKRESSSPQFRVLSRLIDGQLQHTYIMRDKTELKANDCIYLICEPPGDPYYLGRIMEFTKLTQNSTEIDAVRVNWFYRPRDIQRQHSDSRLLFATMHSDLSPLHSIRGKCRVEHKSQIDDPESYRKQPDSFYYERLFDKFMRRQYEVIPVRQVINVPEKVRRVLQERWKYVVVEVNRVKELAMDHRACKRCGDWCASKDSVRCAICKSDFHMQCVQPPLPRKPTRGFAWSCTACSRAEARRIEDARLPGIDSLKNGGQEKIERCESSHEEAMSEAGDLIDSFEDQYVPDRDTHRGDQSLTQAAATPEQWPYRYLGIHCNVNDAVDRDDRIYPRAASRIGPRHQAVVHDWPGRHIEYFERSKRPIKRTAKAMKGKRSDERAAIELAGTDCDVFAGEGHNAVHGGRFGTVSEEDSKSNHVSPEVALTVLPINPATMTAAERPAWLLEKPANYLARGEGRTAERIWSAPGGISNLVLSTYLEEAQSIARKLKVDAKTPNFIDVALKAFCDQNYDKGLAIQSLSKLTRKSIGEPSFSSDEKIRFETSVQKHGSELYQVAQDVGTKSVAECVRYYYMWKKTSAGSKIWANSEARKPKQEIAANAKALTGLVPADGIGDSSDDSAYSISKAVKLKKVFHCKYCQTTKSRRWRRAPGTACHSSTIAALCNRCADLWRKYAVPWESPEEVYKKLHEGGARNRKRKFEEELIKELPADGERPSRLQDAAEPMKVLKKIKKVEREKQVSSASPALADPCAVCRSRSELLHSTCVSCGLHVHNTCYGLLKQENDTLWQCDPCINDASPAASMTYACVLCPVRGDSSAPNSSGPLKRTAANNWAHITCATWIPDLRFGDSSALQPVEGIGALPLAQALMICSVCETSNGYCVLCTTCSTAFHVECAHRAGHVLGFDLQPIKSSQSRRDSLALVRIGTDSGLMTPVIHCSDHDLRRVIVHDLSEVVPDSGESVLSLYNTTYKNSTFAVSRKARKGLVQNVINNNPAVIASKYQELRAAETDEKHDITSNREPSHSCSKCQIQHSACFYPLASPADSTTSQELCHRCYWTENMSGTVQLDLSTQSRAVTDTGETSSTCADVVAANAIQSTLTKQDLSTGQEVISAVASVDKEMSVQ